MMISSNDSDSSTYNDNDRDLALAWNYARQDNWLYNVDEDGEISFKKDERIAYPWMLAQEELKRHAKKYTSNEEDYKKELHNLQDNVFTKNDSLSRSAAQNALIKSVKNLALARNLCAAEPDNWNEIPGFSFDNPTPIFLNKKNGNIISTNDMANMEIERCQKEIKHINDMKKSADSNMEAQSQGSYLNGRSDQDLKEIGQILALGRHPHVYELVLDSPSANQEDNERVEYQSKNGQIEAFVRKDEITITDIAAGGSASSKETIGMKENIFYDSPNPIETYNIAIPLLYPNNPYDADIYLLRQQTPEHILRKIDTNYVAVLNQIQSLQGVGQHLLTRIGYFKFEYKNSQFKLYYIHNPEVNVPGFDSVHRNAEGDISYPFLSYEQLNELLQNSIEFRTLFSGLVEKTIYEIFIRKNLHTDVDFEQIVSLDLYPNRAKDESTVLKFHLDATPSMETAFFTLMYLMPTDIKIKGPTIVTKTDLPVRNQVTLIVENGTIIGVDNDVVLHATSDSIVRIFENEEEIPAGFEHQEFKLRTNTKNEMIENYRTRRINEEMEKGINENDAAAIVDQGIISTLRMVEENTRNISRSFIRTWYLDRSIINPSSLSELSRDVYFQINMDYIKEQISIFNANTTIIVTNKKEDPDVIIASSQVQYNSLGGGKRSITGGVRVSGQNQGIQPSSQDNSLLERNKFLLNSLSSKEKTENQLTNPKGSITMLESFSQLFNKVCNQNFIIKQCGKPIITRNPNKGGKKFKNYNFLKYMKTKKYKKSRNSMRHLKTKNRRHLKTKNRRHLKTKSRRHLKTKNRRYLKTKSRRHLKTKSKTKNKITNNNR